MILVVGNGDIREHGTHDNLTRSGGLQAVYCSRQFDAVG